MPCFWQSRIQSADLSSHVYNAWLASEIQQGHAPGLWITPQSTNILFDLMLERLLLLTGPDLAQRIAVSIAVIIFGWGAVLFIFRVAGRNWWVAGPCVAMLAYGFVFHMGFFNFYLSMGFCLWLLAIFWNGKGWIRLAAFSLLIPAWMAHPLPVAWAIATAGYILVANRLRPRRRVICLLLGLASLVAARLIATHRYPSSWSTSQWMLISGANQIVLFGLRYVVLLAALLLAWAALLHRIIQRVGISQLASNIPFQLWVLNAFAVLLIPRQILLPQYGRPLGYIAERLSLGAALMMCCVLAAAPTTRVLRLALIGIAILFFAFLYADDRSLNRMEDGLDMTVTSLPFGSRVITLLRDQSLRSLCEQHNVDRACVGRCFSYGNYEPSSRQFRVRASLDNPVVLGSPTDVEAVDKRAYVVRSRDLPLYLVFPCGINDVCTRSLAAGESIASQTEKPN